MDTILLAAGDLTDPAGFATAITATAGTALLYISGGAVGGLSLFAAGFGIAKGIKTLRSVGK